MNAGIGNKHAIALGFVAAPNVVEPNGFFHSLTFEDGTMQRADGLYVESGSLLQYVLHLHAILAADVEVVAACFASPVTNFIED